MKVPALVPEDYDVPVAVENNKFRIRMLSQDDVAGEYEALMSSIDFLQQSNYFDPTDQPWPCADTKVEFVWSKLGAPAWDHFRRSTFHYAIYDLAEMQQHGGFTITNSRHDSYDAQVVLWLRESTVKAGLDAEIFNFLKSWLKNDWPLGKTAFPGWDHDWQGFSRKKLVPESFDVPNDFIANECFIRLMGPQDFLEDMKACFDDVSHLQGVFGPDEMEWPEPNITPKIHFGDLGWCDWSHYHRHFFAYCVYTEDKNRQRGCIYVHPTSVADYDAEVVIWVTKYEYDNGFDEQLYAWVKDWIATKWPFKKVGFPGREIDWVTWNQLPEKT